MVMEDVLELTGFHGTTQQNANQIRREGFKVSKIDWSKPDLRNPNDLGEGVYFFQDFRKENGSGRKMAFSYAYHYKDKVAQKQKCSIEVLEANITVSSDNFLDMDSSDNLELFYSFKDKHKHEREKIKRRLKQDGSFKRKNYDGIMMELFISKIHEQYGSQTKIKVVGKNTVTILKGEISNFPNGTELCVRDTSCIKIKGVNNGNTGNEFKKFL